ncbi:MAG: hypothetical protein ABR921_04990 [Candidatus Sulfotelmatobacter sp.]
MIRVRIEAITVAQATTWRGLPRDAGYRVAQATTAIEGTTVEERRFSAA